MIKTVSSILSDFYGLYERGGSPRGQSAGWLSLDPLFTIRRGEWTLVTGIPGHGKSSFVDNVIVNTAREHDWKWLVFSAENQPAVRHAANLASIYIGRPFGRAHIHRMSQDDWLYASAFLDTQVKFIEPSEHDCNIEAILMNAMAENIQGLVIDPWNELDHSRPMNVTETEYISQSLSRVRRFAKERDVHVIIVAHPSKLIRQKASMGDSQAGAYPVPTPYDVSGSAHWRNKADNCIAVWRDVQEPRSETQIHVQKIRFREIGAVGLCKLYYDPVTGQYIDPLTGARPAFSVEAYQRDLDAKINRHECEMETAMEREA